MKTYEITFITKEDVKDKPVKDILTGLDGKILNTSSIGEKQFAYKIKKLDRGFYSTVLFDIEPEKSSDLNKKLSLTEDILRFLIVAKKPSQLLVKEPKVSKKPEAPIEIAEPKEIAAPVEIEEPKKIEKEKPATEKAKPVKKAAKKVEKVVKEEKPKVSKEVTEIEKETESEEDRLKALDEKLDELLKE